jgi:arylsulfatase A-like enzyme
LVSTIDLAPTILAACGIEASKEMPGLSLLETAAGKGPLARDAVFGEIYLHTAVNLDQPALNLTHRWARAGDWKLIQFEDAKTPPELYKVKEDPFEEKNLAAQNPDQVRRLSARIDAWWQVRKVAEDNPGRDGDVQ